MTQQNEHVAIPAWTGAPRKRGLDPLGMQYSGIVLYQSLLPGISNVTLRMRYYGLYSWLAWKYANKIGSTDPERWRHFLRRAEAVYALIGARNGEQGVAGSEWAGRVLTSVSPSGIRLYDSDMQSPPHLKQKWGAYGAAYEAQLRETKLFAYKRENHVIPVASKQFGEPLAVAFENANQDACNVFLRVLSVGHISLEEIDVLKPLTPSAIATDSEERDIYQRILFSNSGSEEEPGWDRRDTLLLVLSLADQMGALPGPSDFRWSMYSQRLRDGTPLRLPLPSLGKHAARWWAYQANDLNHVCFETLLRFVLDTLQEKFPGGVTFDTLMDELIESVMAYGREAPSTWGRFVAQTALPPNAWGEAAGNEHDIVTRLLKLRASKRICDAGAVWDALRLLAILQNRLVHVNPEAISSLAGYNPKIVRSIISETNYLSGRDTDDFRDTLRQIFAQRVIRRHLWVAVQKLRHQNDYTFLINSDDGLMRLRQKDGPVLTNPRVASAIAFLRDTHLVGETGLTPHGRAILEAA